MNPLPILDQGPITELLEIGGPNLVQELTQLFYDDTPSLIAEIESAMETEDWEALSRASHSLKSSAFYVGALALSELSRELETQANAKAVEPCTELSKLAPGAFDAARAALEAMCSELPPS